jgi:hypothetical protein
MEDTFSPLLMFAIDVDAKMVWFAKSAPQTLAQEDKSKRENYVELILTIVPGASHVFGMDKKIMWVSVKILQDHRPK